MISRRNLLACAALACAVPFAQAQGTYPNNLVKFIVPFAPGGDTDLVARIVAAKLTELHNYKIVVENKPGAGGNIGSEYALGQPADGYTLLVISGSYITNALTTKQNFDAIGGTQPVIQFTRSPAVFVVGANSRFKTLQDFIQAAKKEPGKLTYGTAGVGSLGNLAGEYLSDIAGIKLNHIPYKGVSGVMTDLVSGRVDMLMPGLGSVRELIQSGKLRALAVGWPTRVPDFPNVPTYAEAGLPKYKVDLWHGLIASKNVPPAVIAKLNADINDVLRNTETKAKLSLNSAVAQGGTPEAFRKVMSDEVQLWTRIVKATGIKPE